MRFKEKTSFRLTSSKRVDRKVFLLDLQMNLSLYLLNDIFDLEQKRRKVDSYKTRLETSYTTSKPEYVIHSR